jgi:hypothetical protein
MINETENLLAALEVVVENLSSSYAGIASDGDEPFHAFAWSTAQQGYFNFSQLLKSIGFLKTIDTNTLAREWQLKTMYHSQAQGIIPDFPDLVNILESRLKNLQAYQLKTYINETCTPTIDDFDGFEACEFIAGETDDGDWLGICPSFPKPYTVHYGQMILRNKHMLSQSTIILKQQIEPFLQKMQPPIIRYEAEVSSGLTFQSAGNEDELIEILLEESCILESWEFKKFLKNKENLDVDEEYSFVELEEFVKTYFRSPRLYVLGNWAVFRLYLVGQIENGDWLGIVTAASWT